MPSADQGGGHGVRARDGETHLSVLGQGISANDHLPPVQELDCHQAENVHLGEAMAKGLLQLEDVAAGHLASSSLRNAQLLLLQQCPHQQPLRGLEQRDSHALKVVEVDGGGRRDLASVDLRQHHNLGEHRLGPDHVHRLEGLDAQHELPAGVHLLKAEVEGAVVGDPVGGPLIRLIDVDVHGPRARARAHLHCDHPAVCAAEEDRAKAVADRSEDSAGAGEVFGRHVDAQPALGPASFGIEGCGLTRLQPQGRTTSVVDKPDGGRGSLPDHERVGEVVAEDNLGLEGDDDGPVKLARRCAGRHVEIQLSDGSLLLAPLPPLGVGRQFQLQPVGRLLVDREALGPAVALHQHLQLIPTRRKVEADGTPNRQALGAQLLRHGVRRLADIERLSSEVEEPVPVVKTESKPPCRLVRGYLDDELLDLHRGVRDIQHLLQLRGSRVAMHKDALRPGELLALARHDPHPQVKLPAQIDAKDLLGASSDHQVGRDHALGLVDQLDLQVVAG
eukprot:751846-Hanusia_phi.AAC.5